MRHLLAAAVVLAGTLATGCASLPPPPAQPASAPSRARTVEALPEALPAGVPRDRFANVASQATGRDKPTRATVTPRARQAASPPPRRTDQMRIHFLPVGTGSCQIVECPGSAAEPILIDCGSKGSAQFDVDTARQYLQAVIGTGRVRVVVSHPDDDHVNWIHKVVDPAQVASLWVGDDYAHYKAPFLDWVVAIMDLPASVRGTVYDTLEDNWSNDGEAVADLACGTADTYVLGVNNGTSPNARSLMLAFQHGSFSATFTGDATGVSEAAAIVNFPDALESTVLAASHHGAETQGSNSQEWADATRPAYVIYSAGSHPNFRHPRCSAVAVYRGAGALRNAPSHRLNCGEDTGWSQLRTSLTEYSTHASGLIVITAGNSASEVSVHCGKGSC